MCNQPIGVMDSGVGGLTVLRELQRVLPQEQYLYYGDNGHCPFGNREEGDLLGIIRGIMDFFRQHKVKAVVLACNTSSALLEKFAREYPFPIFSIITPVAGWVVHEKLSEVGVIATAMTIQTAAHARQIHALDPSVQVAEQASLYLAGLVDDPNSTTEAIAQEVQSLVHQLGEKSPVQDVILGCTHYPIVRDVFEKAAPHIRFIDPATSQVYGVQAYLQQKNCVGDTAGRVDIFTTGDAQRYPPMLKRLGISLPYTVNELPAP